MRVWLCFLLLCSFAVAQDKTAGPGPDFGRAARERGAFYLNGVGHQYIRGSSYTVVAAAIPILNGKYFGVKLHVFNRGQKSANLLPQGVSAEDSVGAKELERMAGSVVAERMRRQPMWAHIAGIAAGQPEAGPIGVTPGVPTIGDLLRELTKDAGSSGVMGYAEAPYPTLSLRGTAKAAAHESTACDLACELRNREIGDGNGLQLPQRNARPEQVEQSELLANTIPPDGDAEGVLYFAMPKLTDRAPVSRTGGKMYLVTVAVRVGDEKFQFVFPPE